MALVLLQILKIKTVSPEEYHAKKIKLVFKE